MISLRKPSASARVARYAQQWRHERQIPSVCASSRFSSSLASCHPSSLSSPPAVVRRHAPTILWLDWSTCCWDRISTHKNKQKGQTFQRHASTLRYGNNQHSTLAKTDGSVAKNGGSKRDIIGKSISQTNVDAFGIRSSSSGRNTNIDLEIPSLDLTKSTQLIPLPPHLMGSIPNITGNDSTTIPTISNSMPFYNQGKKSTTVKDPNENHLEEVFADNGGSKIGDIPPLDLANLSFSILHSSKLKNTSVAASGGNATNVQPTETSFDATGSIPNITGNDSTTNPTSSNSMPFYNQGKKSATVKDANENHLEEIFADNGGSKIDDIPPLDLANLSFSILHSSKLKNTSVAASGGNATNVQPTETSFDATDKSFQKDIEHAEEKLRLLLEDVNIEEFDENVKKLRMNLLNDNLDFKSLNELDLLVRKRHKIMKLQQLLKKHDILSEGDLSISTDKAFVELFEQLIHHQINASKDASKDGSVIRFKQIIIRNIRLLEEMVGIDKLIPEQRNILEEYNLTMPTRLIFYENNIRNIRRNLTNQNIDPRKRFTLENELRKILHKRQEELLVVSQQNDSDLVRIKNAELRLLRINDNIFDINYNLQMKELDPSNRRILENELQHLFDTRQEILGLQQNVTLNLENENHNVLRINNTEDNRSSLRLIHIEENIRGVRKALANKKTDPSKRRILKGQLQRLLGKRQEILDSEQNDSPNLVNENHDFLRTYNTEENVSSLRLIHIEENIRGVRKTLANKKTDPSKRRILKGQLQRLLGKRQEILGSQQNDSANLVSENHDVLRTNSTEDRIRGIRRSLRLKKLDQHQRRSLEGRLRKLLHEHNSRNRAAELLDNRDGILDSHQRSSPTLENENGSHMLDTVDHDSGLQTQQAPSSANTNLTVASYLESIVKTYLMASGGSAGSRDIGRYLSTRDSSTGNKSALLEMKDSFGNLLAFLYPRSDVFSVNGGVVGSVGRLVSLKGCENKKNIANDQQHSQIQVQRLNTHPYPSLANNYYSKMVEEGVTTGSGGIGRNLMPSMINIQSSSFLIPGALTLPSFRSDLITTQANGTILGHCGSTSVLSTVVVSPHIPVQPEDESKNEVVGSGVSVEQQKRKYHNILQNAIHRANARSGAVFVPLQVEYRERYHASGKIPSHNRRRRDNGGPLSDKEILAARVIDRSLRPWLMMGLGTVLSSSSLTETGSLLPESIVVNCEVQSYDHHSSIGQMDDKSQPTQQKHADPTALAINSSIAALIQSANSNTSPSARFPIPSEAAACVKIAINRDGSVIFDPTPKELAECKFELLYAGTRDRVLMLEFGSRGCVPTIETESRYNYAGKEEDPGVEESTVAKALRMAHEAIIPIIEHQEELRKKNAKSKASDKDEALMTDEEVAALLGLRDMNACKPQLDSADSPMSQIVLAENADRIIDQAFSHVWSKLETIALKIFGCNKDDEYRIRLSQDGASIHEGSLLPKKIRGRREHILQAEIGRIIRDEFAPDNDDLATFYRSACQGSNAEALTYHIHELVMKRAMAESAERMCRSDGRRGLNVVRPISATAPFLPDCVHGSALFSRGETQVLCTATLGNPREGLPIADPYADDSAFDRADACDGNGVDDERSDQDNKVPIGSLRFLRSQMAMESDMNSRKVKAGREMTGDSGTLKEIKRFFLHYDFPDFSTGIIKSKAGASANRRAVGHGALAEKSIVPVLPHPNQFPYAIRLTSEVTSSNGSSSMASACGATLALLDAGVPLLSPVAGVSVGLAPNSQKLLLDITGTEDHYGDMDFKICGTLNGITAMQLDVKRPLPLQIIIDALDLAREGRRSILNAMENECKSTLHGLRPRPNMKSSAPRVEIIKFDPNRKRDLIGPGGAVLRQLEDRFNVSLDLSQEGRCLLFGPPLTVSKAKSVIMDLVADVEEGGVYEGTVIELKDYGAVIELLRNKEGLLHVSEITSDVSEKHPEGNMGLVREHLKIGDKIEVLCTKIDHVQGSIKLSRKKLIEMRERNSIYKSN